jgi:hypothetical protein
MAQDTNALPGKEKGKKQILLRLSPSLWEDLAAWAEADFRSINGQIEFLLHEAVAHRKNRGDMISLMGLDHFE